MSTPVWLQDDVVASSTGDGGAGAGGASSPHSNISTPSWLADDIPAGSGGTEGDFQMTALQQIDDGVVPTHTGTTTDTTTSTTQEAARERKTTTTWGEFWSASFRRDGRTLLITLLVIVVMNIPYLKWALYPFTIFSTWIHELCHGLAALMVPGGRIVKMEIFPDTSGLCTFTLPANSTKAGFVTSAGYQGTAVIGMLLLTIRRTKRGPRAGTMAVALFMVLSVALWIRNAFGIAFMLGTGVILGIAAWFMSSWWIRNLYVVLSVTCALNAITSVKALFGTNQEVNGNEVVTDAQAMANIQGGSHTMWALIWLCMALVCALLGFTILAIPGPDEVADFTLCGMCQDMGCFYICNAQGRRLWTTMFGKTTKTGDDDGGGGGDTHNASNTV